MPGDFYDVLQKSPAPATAGPVALAAPARPGYLTTALEREAEKVRTAPEGSRNHTLNSAAFSLGQLVAVGLNEGEVIRRLSEAAEAVGLPSREIARTLRSGLSAGKQQPRVIPTSAASVPDVAALPEPRPHRVRWSAVDLLATNFAPVRYAVPGIIPEGFTLLPGPPKVGKSWLALNIAVAVASGGKVLGSVAVDCAPVLYLALEDTPRRLASRLRTVLGDEPAPENLTFVTEWPRGLEAAERLNDHLEAVPDTGLVIIDVLAKIRGRSGAEEAMYDADYRFASSLKAVADRHGTSLLGVHHVRKAAATDFVDTVSGTHGLAGAADTIAVLKRARTETDAVLSVTGRDVDEAEHALTLDGGVWRLDDPLALDHGLSDTRRRVLDYLAQHPDGVGPTQLATALNMTTNTAKQTLRRMAEDNQIAQRARGLYVARTSPVTSVTSVTFEGDRGDEGDRGSHCTVCRFPLDPVLAELGETTHAGCEA